MENQNLHKRTIDKREMDKNAESSQSRMEYLASLPSNSQDQTPEFMKEALKDMTPRWRNWWIRTWYTILMIAMFSMTVYFGTFALLIMVVVIQVKCFHEIIGIGYHVCKSYDLPLFRSLSWYFLLCANYFFYGESLGGYFGVFTHKEESLMLLSKYHRMISYLLYLAGLIMFILSLIKTHYRLQFYMFSWTHLTLLIIVTQSHLLMQNLMEGLVWGLLPMSMVICNDCMAYMFGFFFGKTPLIKLSPKKTWEGFIGGCISTIVFGWFFSAYLCQFSSLTCPTIISSNFTTTVDCKPAAIFQLHEYAVPVIVKLIGVKIDSVYFFPFQLHSLAISTFASLIAPFGGFFASGFKRAFKIKDFGDTIPGHGGFMDRFDCQYLMGTFVNVYVHTFIRLPSAQSILPLVFALSVEDQIEVYHNLKADLGRKGLI